MSRILGLNRSLDGGGHGIIREQVVERVQAIVDEFGGLDVKF